MVGGAPCASATRTVPLVTCRICHDALPSWKTSPADALDGEVLVERADERFVRVEHDAVVGDLRDGAARGLRQQPRAAPAAHRAMDLVAMEQRGAAAAPGREPLGRHGDHRVERRARQLAIGPGPPHQREEIVSAVAAVSRAAHSATICCARTSSGASC